MDASRRGAWLAILSLAAVMVASGCERLFVFPAPGYHLRDIEQHLERPIRSASTSSLLEHLELEDLAASHPQDAFSLLERDARLPPAILTVCLRWRNWPMRSARTVPSGSTEAILWSRDAAVYAVFCLAELKERRGRHRDVVCRSECV